MYICPICRTKFKIEELVVKHYNKCWKEKNPGYKGTTISRQYTETRTINDDVSNFFNSLQKG